MKVLIRRAVPPPPAHSRGRASRASLYAGACLFAAGMNFTVAFMAAMGGHLLVAVIGVGACGVALSMALEGPRRG